MKYARIVNKTVVEILVPVEGFTFEQCFHIDIADKCIPVGDEVTTGWTEDEEGILVAPMPAPIVIETVIEPIVS